MANSYERQLTRVDVDPVAALVETFDTTGNGQWFTPQVGAFNLFVDFTTGSGVGSVQLQRRRGSGAALPITGNGSTLYNFTADASEIIVEVEPGISYRMKATITSGTIATTMSQFA